MSPGGDNTERAMTLSVIAPCLNESANIDSLADRMLRVFDSLGIESELILIDDGSHDDTWEKIRRRGRGDRRIRGQRHPVNFGMETAWRTGLAASRGTLVCLIDADLQNRPEDIPTLLQAHREGSHDVIQAVRRSADSDHRLMLFTRGLNVLLNTVFRMRARDNKSGFVLCKREVLAHILNHRNRYRYFQTFLGVSAHARGYRIQEIDTIFERRHGGESFLNRLPLLVSARILWEIGKYRIELWKTGLSPAERPQAEWSPHQVLATAAGSDA